MTPACLSAPRDDERENVELMAKLDASPSLLSKDVMHIHTPTRYVHRSYVMYVRT